MTCIAAVTDGRIVAMAADSLAVDSCGQTVELTKLLAFDGVLIGVAGRAAAIAVLRRKLHVEPPAGGDDPDEWAQDVAEQATRVLLEAGVVNDGDDRSFPGALLLAHGHRAWEVETNMAIPCRRGYHAVGSGDQVAAGALWALAGGDNPVADVARLAVEAAIEHQVDCGGEVLVLTT